MEKDTIKTYCRKNPRKKLRRNPFDDLLPDQCRDVFKAFEGSSTVDTRVSKRDKFKIYEDSRMGDDKKEREVLQIVTRKPRSATPIAQLKFTRVSKRPVRSPRISKVVTAKSSSEDDIESERSDDEENWTTYATESSEDKTETEYSSIELPREAGVEKIGIQEIDLPVKLLSSPRDQSTPVGTDESSEFEIENRQRLNSTLLDDGFAKNIDELKGFMDVSPILNEECEISSDRDDEGDTQQSEDDEVQERVQRQIHQEITPTHVLISQEPKAPQKRRQIPEEDKVLEEMTELQQEASLENNRLLNSRKKLSPMYNLVETDQRRILKRTSTPVRSAFQPRSPPVFCVDISSVRKYSNLELYHHRSPVVNSDEIHVSTEISPAGLSNPRLCQSLVPVNENHGEPIVQASEKRVPVATHGDLSDSNCYAISGDEEILNSAHMDSCEEEPCATMKDKTSKKINKRNVSTKNKRISKKILPQKKPVKATISAIRRMNKKSRRKNVSQDSVFAFSIHSSSSETTPVKSGKYGLKKTRVITSESPSREGDGNYQKRKIQTPHTSYSGVLSSKSGQSSTSSKKSVTWGSETRHQYHETSPVHCNRKVKQKPSDFPLCIIVALDDMWPPKQIAIETYKNLRPLSKGKTSPRNACELDILCRDW